MIARKYFFAVTIALVSFCNAQKKEISEEERKFYEAVNKPIVLTVPGMDQIKVLKDRKYKNTTNPNLLADIYLPTLTNEQEKHPAVVFIHGGSGQDGDGKLKDWGFYQSWGRAVAASGYVGITFNQSLGFPKTAIPQGAQDVNDLIDYIRAHAEEYYIDKEKIALMVYSGGGPLITIGMRNDKPYIKCLVAFYAFLDANNEYIKKSETIETQREFSALTWIRKHPQQITPLLVLRAGADQIPGVNSTIDAFIAEANKVDLNVSFMNNPGAPHGFDNNVKTRRTVEILKEVLRFLDWNLKPQTD